MKMINAERLSAGALMDLWKTMSDRLASIAAGESREEEYNTQETDWQGLYTEIRDELNKRGLL